MYGFQVIYNNKFMTLLFVGQKRAAEISANIQQLLQEVTNLTSEATAHSDAIEDHKHQIGQHEEEWRRCNRRVSEKVEKARALQKEFADVIAGEYCTCYT